jgi:cell division protein FtsQ
VPITVESDRRFRRAHVRPARKRRWWNAPWARVCRVGLLLAAVAYGGFRGAALAADAEMFHVSRITVKGNSRLSSGEVTALMAGIRGESILRVDLEAWRTRLRGAPWVRDAALRRLLPSSIEVVISERQPIGIGRIGSELFLVDEDGTIVDEFGAKYADLDMTIIDGLVRPAKDGGTSVDPERASLAARVLSALQAAPEIGRRVSQLDVSDARDAVVLLDGDTALLRLGDSDFVERLRSYLDLAPALREQVPLIDSVDLRFGERVYVRPSVPARNAQRAPARRVPTAGAAGTAGQRRF